MTTTSSARTYTIAGRAVTMPVVVREASSGSATFLVPSRAARRWLPGPSTGPALHSGPLRMSGLDVVELLPGRALLSIACIDYRDNDLGDYNEVSIALFVRRRGRSAGVPYLGTMANLLRGRVATYIHRLPVNQEFTCEAGRTIWGFPKTVNDIKMEYGERRMSCVWKADGELVLAFTMPRGGSRTMPDAALTTYSYIEGAAHRTRFVSGADGVGFRLGGANVRLGRHPISDELRALGLPKRPLFSVWMERMRGRFEAPVPLR